MAFGVAMGNPFALLGEDEENDDPQKITLPLAAPAPDEQDQPPEGGAARGGRGRVADRGRGGRGGGRGGRGRSEYAQRSPDGVDAFEERPSNATAGGGRYGPARGGDDRRGRGRGGRQRDFDRRDQSGRGHELEKRGGGGKGNWGGAADSWEEIPTEENQPLQNGSQAPGEGEPAVDEYVKDAGAEAAAEPEEKEEVKLTLAEYEEMRKEKLLTKVVKKGKVDMGQFEGLSEFVKDDVETGFEALELEKTKKMKQKTKKEFVPVETGFRVGDPVRRGRGRGGPNRGGGRGSRDLDREGSGGSWGLTDAHENNAAQNSGGGGYRGRGRGRGWDRRPGGGGYREGPSHPKQPSLDDQASFPSLA